MNSLKPSIKRVTGPSGGPLRAISYARVSSEEQAQNGVSLGDQATFIARGVEARLGVGNVRIVAELSDPGITGARGPSAYDVIDDGTICPHKSHRPGLTKALQMLLDDEADVLVVYNFSRLYRDGTMGAGLVDRILKPRGQDLISIQEPVDVYTPAGMLQMVVLGGASKYQIASGNQVIRDNLRERKVDGGWLGTPPYGWRWAKKDGRPESRTRTIEPIPEQINHVREVANSYLAGHSEGNVAKLLNARGIPFILKKEVNGSRTATWTKVHVRILLRNAAHAGQIMLDGVLKPGLHYGDRAYDLETYEQIQETLTSRRTRFRGVKNERPEMMLAGLVTCGSCGERLAARFSDGLRCYTCRGQKGDAVSKHVWVNAQTLEMAVLHEVAKVAALPEVLEAARTRIGLSARQGHEALFQEVEQVRDRVAAFKLQKQNALRQLREGFLSDELFKMQIEAISSDELLVKSRFEELELALSGSADVEKLERRALESLNSFQTVWDHLVPCERSQLLRTVVEKLEITDLDSHSVASIKLHLMPEVVQPLPRIVAARNGLATGLESITSSELACLWHLGQGKLPSEGALAMGISRSSFSGMVTRAARRLDAKDSKEAVRKARAWVIRSQHLLPLTGAQGRRRKPRFALSALEATAIDLRKKGLSADEVRDQFGISTDRVRKLLAEADAKMLAQESSNTGKS